jgi:hypothetical protein
VQKRSAALHFLVDGSESSSHQDFVFRLTAVCNGRSSERPEKPAG